MARPKNQKPTLSDRETEILNILWDNGELFIREILALLPEPRPHFNTVATIVHSLERKGFVKYEQIGGAHRYTAIAKPSDFATTSLSRVISNFFGGSAVAAVSALVKDESISADELREILDIIENKSKS